MAFCTRCGTEIDPGSAFCKACGAPVKGAEEPTRETPTPPSPPQEAFRAAPPRPPEQYGEPQPSGAAPAPPPSAAPSYGPAPAPPVMAYAPPAAKKGGGGKALLFGLLGILVIGIAVVLVLGFAVGPKWFVGGGEGPEKTVGKFFQAMEKGDAKLMVSLIEPSQLKRLKDQISDYYGSVEELFQDYYEQTFPEGDLRITGLEYRTEIDGDLARVEVTAGQATYTDYNGDRVTESVDDPEEVFSDTHFNLKRVEGTWYLMPEFD